MFYRQYQISSDSHLFLYFPYPNGTEFNVTAIAATCYFNSNNCRNSATSLVRWPFRRVADFAAVRAGAGDVYAFDGSVLLVRVGYHPSYSCLGNCSGKWSIPPVTPRMSFSNVSIPNNDGKAVVQILAACTPLEPGSPYCAHDGPPAGPAPARRISGRGAAG